jgi:spore germination protein KC
VIRSDSKIIASCQDEKPSILVQIKAVANIAAIDGVMDISADENKKFIARLLEKRLNNLCGSALQKAQGTLCSDIFGFGEAIHRKYPELWKELKSDWSRGFPDLPVDFEITVEINQLGQIKKPMFRKEE